MAGHIKKVLRSEMVAKCSTGIFWFFCVLIWVYLQFTSGLHVITDLLIRHNDGNKWLNANSRWEFDLWLPILFILTAAQKKSTVRVKTFIQTTSNITKVSFSFVLDSPSFLLPEKDGSIFWSSIMGWMKTLFVAPVVIFDALCIKSIAPLSYRLSC